jgi:twitching motility protein PilT
VDAFPTNQQAQIRTQLAAGLQAVISQILLPKLNENGEVSGRIAAFEIMTSTDAIRSRIRDNKTNMIKSDLQTGAKYGMVTLDACLTEHYKNGYISYDELITKSQDPDTVVAKLKEEMGRN